MAYSLNHEIYNIGRFDFSDKKATCKIIGAVETKDVVIKTVFWIGIKENTIEKSLPMSFSSIELRTLAKALYEISSNPEFIYRKESGGNTSFKTLSIDTNTNYCYLNYNDGMNNHSISLPKSEMCALGDEILFLIEKSVDASYELQRYIEKKKRIDKKKERKQQEGTK